MKSRLLSLALNLCSVNQYTILQSLLKVLPKGTGQNKNQTSDKYLISFVSMQVIMQVLQRKA